MRKLTLRSNSEMRQSRSAGTSRDVLRVAGMPVPSASGKTCWYAIHRGHKRMIGAGQGICPSPAWVRVQLICCAGDPLQFSTTSAGQTDNLQPYMPHLQARLEHATQVGSAQQAAEQEERSRMAALAEQVANQAAQREGETRRRHEEAMSQLALAREKQAGLVVLAPCRMLVRFLTV